MRNTDPYALAERPATQIQVDRGIRHIARLRGQPRCGQPCSAQQTEHDHRRHEEQLAPEAAPGGIGFVRAADADDSVKVLKIAGVAPGQPGYPIGVKCRSF
jgi:hypothetical protein